jgi:hypothetical protein
MLTKVGEEEKEEKEKLAASMPRHFPEEMAEANICVTNVMISNGLSLNSNSVCYSYYAIIFLTKTCTISFHLVSFWLSSE